MCASGCQAISVFDDAVYVSDELVDGAYDVRIAMLDRRTGQQQFAGNRRATRRRLVQGGLNHGESEVNFVVYCGFARRSCIEFRLWCAGR